MGRMLDWILLNLDADELDFSPKMKKATFEPRDVILEESSYSSVELIEVVLAVGVEVMVVLDSEPTATQVKDLRNPLTEM